MFLRSSIVIACLSALLTAQRGGEEGSAEEQVRLKRQAMQEGNDVKDNGEKGDPDNAWEKMTPEQRLNHNIRHGASAYCRFMMSVKPAKLMPGQSGTLIVTAILLGQAVLPAPAPLEVLSAPQQGLLTLGSPAFRPAAPGKGLAQGYVGKPVYENYAIFEVPVTMGTEAVIGRKLPIALDLKFDLYDGVSTQPVGRFTDRATTDIEVGQVADPSVIRGVHTAGSTTGARGAEPEQGSDAALVPGATPAKGKTLEAAAPMSAPSEEHPTPAALPVASGSAPPADEDGGLPLPPALLIGGGVVLLVVLLLVLKRR